MESSRRDPDSLLEDLGEIESLLELDLCYHLKIGTGQHLSFYSALKSNMKLTELAFTLHTIREAKETINLFSNSAEI